MSKNPKVASFLDKPRPQLGPGLRSTGCIWAKRKLLDPQKTPHGTNEEHPGPGWKGNSTDLTICPSPLSRRRAPVLQLFQTSSLDCEPSTNLSQCERVRLLLQGLHVLRRGT